MLNKNLVLWNVGGIENYISTYYMNYREFEKPVQNGRNIAIRSGPAGISCYDDGIKGYKCNAYE